MDRYAIRAYESAYQGTHGIESTFMTDASSLHEARQIAAEASREVMDSYYFLIDDIIEEARENFGESYTDEDVEAIKDEKVCYEIYKIKDACTMNDKDIDETLYQDFDNFIQMWCTPCDK